ncbi:pseudouridine synthase [Vibrio genomosp. F10 str. 9ZC157]|uniref:RNA pseudouridine synthase n=1 Tax=Vibrio genomosp. F10 str. ZF-129 TaxID=1187848 RepID=A0A1E5BIX3_9VIBR|nr:RluA family pseudouridine synthase [Vibrio genomosp. F10]OEE37442.1 RNA pseudouridine synthase [Vibrio genomosp. F10 str. ZF-129]OEE92922.1 RNA pseudouridine synthase [Vibrio genomosp. F10 str. 9ZC157]
MNPQPVLANKLSSFKRSIDHLPRPKRFTFPYYYTPHPLAVTAMSELQHYLATQKEWKHDFSDQGKMFAVLVVETQQGELGYLSSFSGSSVRSKLPDESDIPNFFVDPIYDPGVDTNSQAQWIEKKNTLDTHILSLTDNPVFIERKARYTSMKAHAETEITDGQTALVLNKAKRKERRKEAELRLGNDLDEQQLKAIIHELGRQSSKEKQELKLIKNKWNQLLDELIPLIQDTETEIKNLQQKRQQVIARIADEKHKSCRFLNREGELKSTYDLFNLGRSNQKNEANDQKAPIAGSSEENLPKLLQTAFQYGLTPLALGEFWWGASPYHQIRQHKNLYPVCQSKCFEILEHMLEGIETDESPLKQTPSLNKELEIIYEDDVLVVVNKPAEFLSVSGKYISDSVHARMQVRYPNATGPLVVHRLDMSTSGLIIFALTSEANKHVQQQFINRSVVKRYTALLEGLLNQGSGTIALPLRGDIEDRPRQMVCHRSGRNAQTDYQVIETIGHRTKVDLYPKTGRTHQLRVHCAHSSGLNTPIVGDDLYGFKDKRLYLHAGYLKLRHPVSHDLIEFTAPSDF